MLDVDLRKLIGLIFSFIIGLVICGMLNYMMCSCTKTVYVPVETVKHDSLIQTKVFVDTLMTHDSVYVRDSGDTVYFYKWRTEYKYKYVKDTAYVAKVDSVAVPYEVVKVQRYIPCIVWYVIGGMILAILGMGAWIRIRS